MTERQIVLRSIACTAGLGAGWGIVAAAFVLASLGTSGVVDFVGTLLIASVYGSVFGAVVGLVLGVPTVFMVLSLRSDLARCRRAGAAWAAALPGVGSLVVAVRGGDAVDGAVVLAVLAIVAGWSAWIGLGWIFGPAAQHGS